MKTKIITAIFLVLGLVSRSQNFVPTGGGANDVYFGPGNGSVAIGPPAATPPLPLFRLDVLEDDAAGSTGNIAGNFEYQSNNATGTQDAKAVRGLATTANNVKLSIGVEGEASSAISTNPGSFNYGVHGIGNGGGVNHGGHFVGSGATDPTAGENVGVYGTVSSGGGLINSGVYGDDGAQGNSHAGLFKGDVEIRESGANASLFLNNIGSSSKWGLHSLAPASFEIEENGANRFFISGGGGTAGRVGIGTTSPANRLHINVAATGDEGLRIQNTNGSGNACLFLQNNTKTWALRSLVAGNGDLLLNEGANTRLFLSGSGNGQVGIGTTSPLARLHVVLGGSALSEAGIFETNNASIGTAVGVKGSAENAGSDNYGVFGTIGNTSSGINAGVYGEGSASATGGNLNAGVFAKLRSTGSAIDAALYAEDNGGQGFAGYFDGDIYVTGVPFSTAGGPFIMSDSRIKKNLQSFASAIEKITRINIYNYEFKTDDLPALKLPRGPQIGVIAQELKEVIPELVKEKQGYNHVNYVGLVPIIIEALKEQQKQIDAQKKLIDYLSQKSELTTDIGQNTSVVDGFQMDQNIPNPFTSETQINYVLPQTVRNAHLTVYDLSGKQLNTYPIDIGATNIIINSEKLTPGMYVYSLIADGALIGSKRMIVADK